MRKSRRVRPESYADQVVAVLAGVFSDLGDATTASIVRRSVITQLQDPSPVFEVVLDSPLVANWRLKAHPDAPGAFRVADCRIYGTAPRPEVDAANARLLALAS